MAKRVSMEDIAKKLGISKNTVSLVLRGMPGISGQTRNLILETARLMGYEYKLESRVQTAKEPQSKNICLIMPKIIRGTVGFYSHIHFGVEDEAKKNNFNTILYYYDEDPEYFETPLCIKEGMISGIITLGETSRNTLVSIANYHLPLVVIDEYFDNLPLDYILTDNRCGGYMATEYLIRCGHSKIAFSGDISCASSFHDRFQGYLKAMKDYGLPVEAGQTFLDKRVQHTADRELPPLINRLRALQELPTAIFCCNDPEAFAYYKAFEAMGFTIPGDISIVGFDDIDAARNVSPELTTMRIEKELMGKKAVCRLIEKMEDLTDATEKILLSTTLIERQSVKKIRS